MVVISITGAPGHFLLVFEPNFLFSSALKTTHPITFLDSSDLVQIFCDK
jgi:hypothetical protein